jgi:hypothetical protein
MRRGDATREERKRASQSNGVEKLACGERASAKQAQAATLVKQRIAFTARGAKKNSNHGLLRFAN